MIVKTEDLIEAPLDWAVAKCNGEDVSVIGKAVMLWIGKDSNVDYEPSTNWAQGGPIIDSEKIKLYPNDPVMPKAVLVPDLDVPHFYYRQYGPTILISAMRCYVASKYGDEIEIPDDLM